MEAVKHPDLPHVPEPAEALRARLPAALAELVTEADMLANVRDPAFQHDRRNVFDCADGFRFVVTAEDHGREHGHVAHVSVSVDPNSSYYDELGRRGRAGLAQFIGMAVWKFKRLFGVELPKGSLYLREGHWPHWYFPLNQMLESISKSNN